MSSEYDFPLTSFIFQECVEWFYEMIVILRKPLQIFQVRHPYHLVVPSPWPIFISFAITVFLIGVLMYMHSVSRGFFVLFCGLGFIFIIMYLWFKDILLESVMQGSHTVIVQNGLSLGMLLFIVSEILFFFAFFWSFFHISLAPGIELGCVWPPVGIYTFDPYALPLVNTYILLASGITITYVHHVLIRKDLNFVVNFFFFSKDHDTQFFYLRKFFHYFYKRVKIERLDAQVNLLTFYYGLVHRMEFLDIIEFVKDLELLNRISIRYYFWILKILTFGYEFLNSFDGLLFMEGITGFAWRYKRSRRQSKRFPPKKKYDLGNENFYKIRWFFDFYGLLPDYFKIYRGFIATLFFAFFFTFLQLKEYSTALFSISDSVFGSLFYVATGFHGMHVIIGATFLFICFIRFYKLFDLKAEHHLGFLFAIWYWHFVDVVWLFLFFAIYWWGSFVSFFI